MLVQVDPVPLAHEHEADAPLLAELVYERLPIGSIPRSTLATAVGTCGGSVLRARLLNHFAQLPLELQELAEFV